MDTIKLAVQERTERGDGPSRRLRANGRIPAVVYGKGSTATSLSVALEDIKAAMAHGHNVVLELELDAKARAARKGEKRAGSLFAVVKDLQFHPTRRQLLHIDLHEVDLAVEIEAPVAIELIGIPAGTEDGGVLDWAHREVIVKALPNAIPSTIEVDVSGLQIGQHVSVAALVAGEGVTIVDDPEIMIAALLPPRVQEEEVTAVEAAEEPEVIGAKSEEE